jgi:hypothetical protein
MFRKSRGIARVLVAVAAVVPGAGAVPGALHAQDSAATRLPPAAEIIDRYLTVTRVTSVVARHSSVRTKAKVETPAQAITASVEELRARPNKVAVTFTRPGRGEVKSGFDGERAWTLDPVTGPRLHTGDELADRRFQSSFGISQRDSVSYPVRQTVELAEFGGEKCYRVRMVNVNMRESFECFSVASGLLVAAQRKSQSQMGAVDNLLLYSEYKEFGGALFATRVVQEVLGIRQVHTLESVVFDDVKPEEFDLPPAVKALIPPAGVR